MRPKQKVVTSGNSPVVIPVDYTSRATSVVALPAGSGNYTVAYTCDNVWDSAVTPTYTNITAMTTATTQQTAELGPITALKITLHSGTSVTISVVQEKD